MKTTTKRKTAAEIAKARTDWPAVVKDRDEQIANLVAQIENYRDLNGELSSKLRATENGLAGVSKARDEYRETISEKLEEIGHLRAEAQFWRGVACGMNPEFAADAENARRGQRPEKLAETMDAGMDTVAMRRRNVNDGLYPTKTWKKGPY